MIASPAVTSTRRSPARSGRSPASTAAGARADSTPPISGSGGGTDAQPSAEDGVDLAGPLPVVIIDEHFVVHAGVRHWLADAPISTGSVYAYRSADEFLAEHDQSGTTTAVIIYDLERSGQRPDYDALQQLSKLTHRVITFSGITSTEVILSCLDAGAVDYIVKSEAPHHLLDAIAAAQHGAPHRGPLAVSAMHAARRFGRPELTPQERRVLIAWLLTDNKDLVSRGLHISASTVRTHLHRIRGRYNEVDRPAPTKAALFARAVQDGLLGINDV